MDYLEELENRVIAMVKINNFDDAVLKSKEFNGESLDAYEFGFAWALHFVLEVITDLKKRKNESCD